MAKSGNDSDKNHYNRRTFLRALSVMTLAGKCRYTVVGVGFPPRLRRVQAHWKKALKSSLRILKYRYGVEYVLLFERSERGHEHAHVVMMRPEKHGRLRRLSKHDISEFRDLFFRILFRRVEEATGLETASLPLPSILRKLHVSEKQAVKLLPSYVDADRVRRPSGHNPAFFGYLMHKPELLDSSTTFSSGLLKLRMKSVSRMRPKGWSPVKPARSTTTI